jgi:hypothetical protein
MENEHYTQITQRDVKSLFSSGIIKGVNFSGLEIKSCKLENAMIVNCSFEDAIMIDCRFRYKTIIKNCNFSNAVIDKVFFSHDTFLTNCNFSNAILKWCTFPNASHMRDCDFIKTDFHCCGFDSAYSEFNSINTVSDVLPQFKVGDVVKEVEVECLKSAKKGMITSINNFPFYEIYSFKDKKIMKKNITYYEKIG